MLAYGPGRGGPLPSHTPIRRLHMRSHCLALASAWALVGCTDTSAPRSADHLAVSVAPLSLPGIGFACYDIAVTSTGETVWTQGLPDTTLLGADQDDAPGAPGGTPVDM